LTNQKYTNNLQKLVAFIDEEVNVSKDEFENRFDNPTLAALMLRAKFSGQLLDMIRQLFTDDSVHPRSIRAFHLHRGNHNG